MWAWRVVVPGAGLAACLAVLVLNSLPAARRPAADGGDAPDAVPTPAAGRGGAGGRVVAEGRVAARPGAEVTVGTESGGTVTSLPAREGLRVRKGDLLVALRADDREAALAEADARLAEAEAELSYQEREYRRRVKSPAEGQQFQTELDAVKHGYDLAGTRRRGALAAAAAAKAALARTRLTAPIDGVVLACEVRAGETAAPGARLVTVCDLGRTWVVAEVDAFDIPRVSPGAAVRITSEGYDESWPGTVEEVPDRVADRSARPDDPGRPSDVRVLLVKVAATRPLPLKLGQQVEVEIQVPTSAPPPRP